MHTSERVERDQKGVSKVLGPKRVVLAASGARSGVYSSGVLESVTLSLGALP